MVGETTFAGHPMAQQGKAGEAMTAAFTSFRRALVESSSSRCRAAGFFHHGFALQFGTAEKFGRSSCLLQLHRHGQGADVQDAVR